MNVFDDHDMSILSVPDLHPAPGRFRHPADKEGRLREEPAFFEVNYRGDVAAATGCRLGEAILMPITSPDTTNSTRRFC